MNNSDLQRYMWKLESYRDEALQFLDRTGAETRTLDIESLHDSADQCITSLSREHLFERSSQRRNLVRMIEVALQRIREGTYGVCVACGDDIQPLRLDAVPWTQYCLRCQETIERGGTPEAMQQAQKSGMVWRQAG